MGEKEINCEVNIYWFYSWSRLDKLIYVSILEIVFL